MQIVSQLQNKFFLFLILFIFSSCASLDKTDASVESAVSKICLDGDGRGRINVQSNKYLFEFEAQKSQTLKAEQEWEIAMDFALHGGEFLKYTWLKNSWKVSGSFIAGLKSFMQSSHKQLEQSEIDQILAGAGEVFRLVIESKKTGAKSLECLQKGVCTIPHGFVKEKTLIKWMLTEEGVSAVVSIPKSKSHTHYKISFTNLKSNLNDERYHQTQLEIFSDLGFKKAQSLLSYDLYWSNLNCD